MGQRRNNFKPNENESTEKTKFFIFPSGIKERNLLQKIRDPYHT